MMLSFKIHLALSLTVLPVSASGPDPTPYCTACEPQSLYAVGEHLNVHAMCSHNYVYIPD